MISEAEGKHRDLGLSRVSFAVGCAEELTERSAFDVIVCTSVFHHFFNKHEVFRRMLRTLHPGGILVVEDICNDAWTMWMLDRLGRLGERAHIGSTASNGLHQLMEDVGFAHAAVDHVRLMRFRKIMIGRSRRPVESARLHSEELISRNRKR